MNAHGPCNLIWSYAAYMYSILAAEALSSDRERERERERESHLDAVGAIAEAAIPGSKARPQRAGHIGSGVI